MLKSLISPYSLTVCLAHLHRDQPKLLSNGRFLSPKFLRQLATHIDMPMDNCRTIRQHQILAYHFILLEAAEFIRFSETEIILQPTVFNWLILSPAEQLEMLRHSAMREHLEMATYIPNCHTLLPQIRGLVHLPQDPIEFAKWVEPDQNDVETWQLKLPTSLPINLLFHLLQLGRFNDNRHLHLTPLSISSFPAVCYGCDHICWLLESATKLSLGGQKRQQLRAWLTRQSSFQLVGSVLITSSADYLNQVYRQRRLRPYLLERISKRHAIVDLGIVPKLKRWLNRKGFPLLTAAPNRLLRNAFPHFKEAGAKNKSGCHSTKTASDLMGSDNKEGNSANLQTESMWLALRIMMGLNNFIPLPLPLPHHLLTTLAATLPDRDVGTLNKRAEKVLDDLRATIRGQDAFFPPLFPPNQKTISWVRAGVQRSHTLCFAYQAVGQSFPVWHHVDPFWLEERGALFYLHGYSHLAEAERTFRLDRIVQIQKDPQDTLSSRS